MNYEVSVPRPCPSYALTCCTNYVWFEGCCISKLILSRWNQKCFYKKNQTSTFGGSLNVLVVKTLKPEIKKIVCFSLGP